MGTKLGFLVGLGAGVFLMAKAKPETVESIRRTGEKIMGSAPVQKTAGAATERITETLHQQGAAMTDRVAQSIKGTLFPQASSTVSPQDESGTQVVTQAGT
ncbi:MAG: hypothetical protein Q4G30_07700 [Actinomycetaceae bacterium]|nr:hypothetical protein [Actinomycetaceae bacterium]